MWDGGSTFTVIKNEEMQSHELNVELLVEHQQEEQSTNSYKMKLIQNRQQLFTSPEGDIIITSKHASVCLCPSDGINKHARTMHSFSFVERAIFENLQRLQIEGVEQNAQIATTCACAVVLFLHSGAFHANRDKRLFVVDFAEKQQVLRKNVI